MAIRYRRNVDCLTENQLHDLREAYQALYDLPEAAGDSFATLGGIHGLPSPTWCDHGSPGFLTWHRAYMKAFERALQCINSDITLPFWDWSSHATTGVPAACRQATYVNRNGDTVANPLYRGPISATAGGGTTNRGANIDTTSFAGAASSAQGAMSSSAYNSFQSALNGPHGSVHISTGGNMGNASLAAFDPIFYLHHCNVDRIWWNWQQANPGVTMPAAEANHPLDPFNRPFSTDWYDGADMDSTDDLGYRYSNWCFWIPPIKIWEVVALRIEPWILRQLRSARLLIRASRMPAESIEFRAFLNKPKASHTSRVESKRLAGSAALFGMGHMAMESRSTSASFDVAIDMTEQIRSRAAKEGNELKLKIVALNTDGEPIEADRLEVDDIELIFE